MGNILFGVVLGVIFTNIIYLAIIAYKKLRIIIKEYKERRELYYGLSKDKREILDEVISTYKYVMKDLNAINDADKSFHIHLLNVTGTLKNRIMNMASTIGGNGGECYVRNKTGITYYKADI